VLTKLDLESVAPVNIGRTVFDVLVDLDPDHPTDGTLPLKPTVTGDALVKGTFSSFFDVFSDLDLPRSVEEATSSQLCVYGMWKISSGVVLVIPRNDSHFFNAKNF
jgi:hypothetical protein